MAKPIAVWVSRDKKRCSPIIPPDYELWTLKPRSCSDDHDVVCWSGSHRNQRIYALCQEEFERVTGFRLEPGECVRVTIEVKPVAKKQAKR